MAAASNPKLVSIEACRGIAALLVLLAHGAGFIAAGQYFSYLPLAGVLSFGTHGVDFFFVLSGFIIYFVNRDALGVPDAASTYLLRRALRIYPVYWLVTVPVILAFLTLPIARIGFEDDPLAILASLALFPLNHPPVLTVAWTLSQEMLFYLLFATAIMSRPAGIVLLAAWQAGVLGYAALGLHWGYPWDFLFNFHNAQFAAGILVAWIVVHRSIPWPRAVAATGAVLFFGLGLDWGVPIAGRPMLVGLAAASGLIIAGLATAERAGAVRTPQFLATLGAASYAIYLVHYPAQLVVIKVLLAIGARAWLHPLAAFAVVVAASIGAGLVLHFAFEQPILRWGHAAIRSRRPRGKNGGGV